MTSQLDKNEISVVRWLHSFLGRPCTKVDNSPTSSSWHRLDAAYYLLAAGHVTRVTRDAHEIGGVGQNGGD